MVLIWSRLTYENGLAAVDEQAAEQVRTLFEAYLSVDSMNTAATSSTPAQTGKPGVQQENTGLFCDARTVPESQIEQVLVKAINQTLYDKESFLATLQNNIETVLSQGNSQALADIDRRLKELQTELLKLATPNADYEKVGDEIYRLRDEKQKLMVENVNRDELKNRIADMGVFLRVQSTTLTEYDESLVRRLIEKITVYEDKFTVEFKSGVTVDVEG